LKKLPVKETQDHKDHKDQLVLMAVIQVNQVLLVPMVRDNAAHMNVKSGNYHHHLEMERIVQTVKTRFGETTNVTAVATRKKHHGGGACFMIQ
jgi:hypothetical protein